MRVLFVDDQAANRKLAEAMLRSQGFEVESARNGEEALALLHRERFDLIVSDILMPEMDGFQFCRAVQLDESLRGIPFAFLTATYLDAKDKEFGLALGAAAFITKPVDAATLGSRLRELGQGQARARAATPLPDLLRDEGELLQRYNERLVAKLERKVDQLEEARARIDLLSRRVYAAQEEERGRLAHELHDDFGQRLTALKLHAQLLQRAHPEIAAGIGEWAGEIDALLDRTRSLARLLHPPELAEAGLAAAVKSMAGSTLKGSGIDLQLRFDLLGSFDAIDEASAIACFRIAQEAVTNAVRHSRARSLRIALVAAEGRVTIDVEDDGAGFAVDEQRGFGIAGMAERARLAGGSMTIRSSPGAGTSVHVEIPLGSGAPG